jgi:hypothetical protein
MRQYGMVLSYAGLGPESDGARNARKQLLKSVTNPPWLVTAQSLNMNVSQCNATVSTFKVA